jgi:hypothetical protein
MHVFGLVLYEMLSGRRAFDQPDFEALVSTIQNIQPPALISLRRDVPPALERLVDRCLIQASLEAASTGDAINTSMSIHGGLRGVVATDTRSFGEQAFERHLIQRN